MPRRLRTTLLASALALPLAPVATPAAALEILGVCLFGSCPQKEAREAEERALIDPLNYDLTFEVTDPEAEDDVATASRLYEGRDEPVAGSAGLLARAKGDYRRILAGLYNEGRYGPSISITINGAQASSIPAGTQFADGANVVVRVEPNPVYRFGTTEIGNRAPPAATRDDEVPSPASVGFVRGEPAKATVVKATKEIAVREWRQQGYPKAAVTAIDARAIHPDDRLDVRLGVDSGPYARYGETRVEGTERMDPGFVAYMTDLPEGEEFDPDDVERARKRLDRLGVFSLRRIEEGDVNTAGLMPMNVIVAERKLRRFEAGVTASTIDGLGLETSWLHRNLFGRAEQLRLSAEIGGIGAASQGDDDSFADGLDYGFGINFKKPGLFTPDTDLLLNAYARRQVNETFRETSYGGSAIVENYLTSEIKLRYGLLFRQGEFVDGFGTRDFTTLTGLFEGQFDFRDSELDPTEGFYFAAAGSPFYEFDRESAGVKLEAELRGYYDFSDEGRSVLAARIKGGSIFGPGLSDLAPDIGFLTGGGGSVRGYAYKSIGVDGISPTGETVAGRSLVEGSLEFRQRFGESFGAVAFVDAGLVSAESYTAFDEDVRVGVGLGLRYYTGLGPVRLDVAVPLNPGPDDGRFGIYAGIGHAF